MQKGYIQVYTGNGKGKTTAALGLALRGAGAGLRIFIAQFIKKRMCSEHSIIQEKFCDCITIRQYGCGFIRHSPPKPSDIRAAQEGVRELKEIMASKSYDLIILDEVNIAVHCQLISVDDLLELMAAKPYQVELVITGRYASEKIIEKADLVTEMREIKHYREKGVKARRGIEK